MIEAEIAGFVLAGPGITGQVGTRIYPVIFAENSPLPALVYRRAATEISLANWGDADRGYCGVQTITFEIDSCAKTYLAAKALADTVRVTLNGYRGMAGNADVQLCRLSDERDGYETERGTFYFVTQSYEIIFG